MESISPKYQMKLAADVEKALWNEFDSSKYKNVKIYISKWHKSNDSYNHDYWENFTIVEKQAGEIDLLETLHTMDGETLIKIAIDLGVDTPDFIPSVPFFRNEIKAEYPTASQTFEKAYIEIEEHPDIAIGLANSALESIIKEMLKDERVTTEWKAGYTLEKLVSKLLLEIDMFPNSDMPTEIRNIASSLMKATQNIEGIRSNNTSFHGKTGEDYLIDDPLYTYFAVNSIVSVGMLMRSLFKKKFPPIEKKVNYDDMEDDLPF
tara:strand:+ start:2143 stop:2931 length:789 start_codon:yes stop_codon:yes gene_type:complete